MITNIKNNNMTHRLSIFTIAALVLVAVYFMGIGTFHAGAAAPEGVPATQYTATTTVIGPQSTVTMFSAKANCAARIISTVDGTNTPIRFLVGDPTNGDIASTTLTGVNGLFQAGSTTVAYDSGIYGCGRWTAEALASTTITIIEMQ